MSPDEKRLTAYHEAGHAVAGWLLPGCDPVLKVSIIPRGQALGLTWSLPDEKVMMSKSDLIDDMCCLVGGRVAEEIINDGVPCTGALNDFERMTKIAYAMVTYYGMSEKVGNLSYYNAQGGYDLTKPYSEKTAQLIDEEAKAIVDEGHRPHPQAARGQLVRSREARRDADREGGHNGRRHRGNLRPQGRKAW